LYSFTQEAEIFKNEKYQLEKAANRTPISLASCCGRQPPAKLSQGWLLFCWLRSVGFGLLAELTEPKTRRVRPKAPLVLLILAFVTKVAGFAAYFSSAAFQKLSTTQMVCCRLQFSVYPNFVASLLTLWALQPFCGSMR
jgi:hypothetical protein